MMRARRGGATLRSKPHRATGIADEHVPMSEPSGAEHSDAPRKRQAGTPSADLTRWRCQGRQRDPAAFRAGIRDDLSSAIDRRDEDLVERVQIEVQLAH